MSIDTVALVVSNDTIMRWNITDVPEDLARAVKLEAARLGISTRRYILDTMALAIQKPGDSGIGETAKVEKASRVRPRPEKIQSSVPTASSTTVVPESTPRKKNVNEMTDREIRIAVRNGEL